MTDHVLVGILVLVTSEFNTYSPTGWATWEGSLGNPDMRKCIHTHPYKMEASNKIKSALSPYEINLLVSSPQTALCNYSNGGIAKNIG